MIPVDVQKLRVLIADDSDDLRERLRALVSVLDCAEVTQETDSAHGIIDIIEHSKVDVAILDIEMPGSGIQALQRIKSEHPAVRVIMLTNHAGAFYRKMCIKAGADFFLDKSLEFERLPSVLSNLTHDDAI